MREIWEELKVGKRWVAPLVAAALLVAVAALDVVRALSRPVSTAADVPRVELDRPELDGFDFESGWSNPEDAGIWGEGLRSRLGFELETVSAAELRLVCRPFPGLDRNQRVELSLNGELLGRLKLLPGNRRYEMPVPAKALHPGRNLIELTYTAHRRVDAVKNGADRLLAVHFSRIRLVAADDGRLLVGGDGGR